MAKYICLSFCYSTTIPFMKKLKFMALEKDCRVFDMYINTASKMAHKTSETSRFPYDIWLSAMDLIHPPALKNYGFFFFFFLVCVKS